MAQWRVRDVMTTENRRVGWSLAYDLDDTIVALTASEPADRDPLRKPAALR
jgi:hypothetical protein